MICWSPSARTRARRLTAVAVLLGNAVLATTPAFHSDKLAEMDSAFRDAIAAGKTPGGVLWLEREGARYNRTFGNRRVVPKTVAATENAIYDAASLTKVIATAPSVVLLIERGKVRLDAPVQEYLHDFSGPERGKVTVRHLLTHTSGLRPVLPAKPDWIGYEHGIELATQETPVRPPGTEFRYSDINFILLGELVRRVDGRSLDRFFRDEIAQPLQMEDTSFLPSPAKWHRIAPTEALPEGVLHGVVHDPTSRRMGGVAGHAGLFVSAPDLARFARMLLNQGELDGTRIFNTESIALMTSVQTPPEVRVRRGLGWDIDSPYASPRGKHFPIGSFGHTGWTGPSIWVDPFSRTFILILTNRNHPTEAGNVVPLRRRLGSLAAEAVVGFNFLHVPGALPPVERGATPATHLEPPAETAVLNGIDVLQRSGFRALDGLKVGLITNHTGVNRHRKPTVELLNAAPNIELRALFSPEHGLQGVKDEKVGDSQDPGTGLAVYSLYGETRKPLPGQLQGLDALVFDIQDIGCRFYTYISTMGLAMEAAAEAGLKFFVLDRVNPIGGEIIDGPVLMGEPDFVGFHTIPVRHGMTVGELAQMFRHEKALDVDLQVIPVEGWGRDLLFETTALPWTNPSPNMRNTSETLLYPGIGLLETTNLSVGRGTDTPFEILGAPYVDDLELAGHLNRAGLENVRFVPVRFTPTASKFKGEACGGVQIVLLDRNLPNVVDIGITTASILHKLYPNTFELDRFARLLRHPPTLDAIRAKESATKIRESWTRDLHEFKLRRDRFLIYR